MAKKEADKPSKEQKEAEEGRLEEVIKNKVMPIVESAVHKFLGVSIDELNKDLTEKLSKNPLVEFNINTALPFKQAKKIFKKQFLKKLMLLNYGNISEVARIAGIDRRSIHRLVPEKEAKKVRHDMIRPYDIKQKAVIDTVEEVLHSYERVIHPDKLQEMYRNVGELSKDILEELPLKEMTLAEAEKEFEKNYFKKALEEAHNNISLAAKRIKIRYETLHRKLKEYGIKI